MELNSQLENDLKNAMRSGDEVRKRTIRMVIAAIKLARVEKGIAPDNTAILTIIQKEIKSRKEAIQEAQKINRTDLVGENQAEIVVLEEYLPKQMSEAELRKLVQETASEINANGIGDMGKVMKLLMPKIQGRAPGDMISAMVRQVLQG